MGDPLIYVVDRTPAGFGLGPTVAEMRRSAERDARVAGWARAKRVLCELIEREVGKIDDIGWVKKIGDGLSRDIFAAEVELADGRCEAYVVALPRADAEPGRPSGRASGVQRSSAKGGRGLAAAGRQVVLRCGCNPTGGTRRRGHGIAVMAMKGCGPAAGRHGL